MATVVSAKSCITREPVPLKFTDHLGKGSGRPLLQDILLGSATGRELLSCIERVRNVATGRQPQRQKSKGSTHGRQHRFLSSWGFSLTDSAEAVVFPSFRRRRRWCSSRRGVSKFPSSHENWCPCRSWNPSKHHTHPQP